MDEVNLEKGNGKSVDGCFFFVNKFQFVCVFEKDKVVTFDAYISTTQIATNNAFWATISWANWTAKGQAKCWNQNTVWTR